MTKTLVTIITILFIVNQGMAQTQTQIPDGEWIGQLPDRDCFNFQLEVTPLQDNLHKVSIGNKQLRIERTLSSRTKNTLEFTLDGQVRLELKPKDQGNRLAGFIKTGKFFYHIELLKTKECSYRGAWHPFMQNNGLQSNDIMLYVENTDNGMVAYPFLGDQRFRGTWTADFKRHGDTLSFRDTNTGFPFKAHLGKSKIDLEFYLLDTRITQVALSHTEDGWDYDNDPYTKNQSTQTPVQSNDGWPTASITQYGIKEAPLQKMIDSVHAQKLVNTHSVLMAHKGKLVFETYFEGFNPQIPHDLRSVSKSISSAMIGIAIDDGLIGSVDDPLYDFLPTEYQYTKDSLKSKIRLQDLLTMSSGMDVNGKASEEYYQNTNASTSWLQTVLEAPMQHTPGTYGDYGSANPFLLGVCLNERLNIPLETYMHDKLFAPLGITDYINQTDDTEMQPYFGGGMLLRPRDLLKFGQLYLNEGQWQGKQILSKEWVADSFKKHSQLQDAPDKNQYGYLWWHETYIVQGKSVHSIEARGAGGQFISILPELETVVVINSGNFRNGKGNQTLEILKDYLLPALLE